MVFFRKRVALLAIALALSLGSAMEHRRGGGSCPGRRGGKGEGPRAGLYGAE